MNRPQFILLFCQCCLLLLCYGETTTFEVSGCANTTWTETVAVVTPAPVVPSAPPTAAPDACTLYGTPCLSSELCDTTSVVPKCQCLSTGGDLGITKAASSGGEAFPTTGTCTDMTGAGWICDRGATAALTSCFDCYDANAHVCDPDVSYGTDCVDFLAGGSTECHCKQENCQCSTLERASTQCGLYKNQRIATTGDQLGAGVVWDMGKNINNAAFLDFTACNGQKCVQCVEHDQCTVATYPFCDILGIDGADPTWSCVECRNDNDCKSVNHGDAAGQCHEGLCANCEDPCVVPVFNALSFSSGFTASSGLDDEYYGDGTGGDPICEEYSECRCAEKNCPCDFKNGVANDQHKVCTDAVPTGWGLTTSTKCLGATATADGKCVECLEEITCGGTATNICHISSVYGNPILNDCYDCSAADLDNKCHPDCPSFCSTSTCQTSKWWDPTAPQCTDARRLKGAKRSLLSASAVETAVESILTNAIAAVCSSSEISVCSSSTCSAVLKSTNKDITATSSGATTYDVELASFTVEFSSNSAICAKAVSEALKGSSVSTVLNSVGTAADQLALSGGGGTFSDWDFTLDDTASCWSADTVSASSSSRQVIFISILLGCFTFCLF